MIELMRYTAMLIALLPSFQELEQEFLLRQQYDDSCGYAAVATLLSCWYGRDVTEGQLLEETVDSGEELSRTVSFADMAALMDSRGVTSRGYRLDIEVLPEVCRQWGPVICWDDAGTGHFYLLVGVTFSRDEPVYIIADPNDGISFLSESSFSSRWSGRALLSGAGPADEALLTSLFRRLDAHEQVHRRMRPESLR